MKDDERLKELVQQREREQQILHENEEAYKKGKQSKYFSYQVEQAQKQIAKNQINELYYGKIFPYTNAIMYAVYYLASLIVLPIVYCGNTTIPAFVFLGLLLVATLISRAVEKRYRANMSKESRIIKQLIKFSGRSAMFCYMLTSIGYLVSMMTLAIFWVVYALMLFLFLISIIYDVIKPLLLHNESDI